MAVARVTAVNRGQCAIALDLLRSEGQALLFRRPAHADVVGESFVPGTMARGGLDCETGLKPRGRLRPPAA